MRADLICFADEVYDTSEELLLFDPNATWKKTRLAGGTYTMREILKPVFIHGECVYDSPSVMEIAEYCRQERKRSGTRQNVSFIRIKFMWTSPRSSTTPRQSCWMP